MELILRHGDEEAKYQLKTEWALDKFKDLGGQGGLDVEVEAVAKMIVDLRNELGSGAVVRAMVTQLIAGG